MNDRTQLLDQWLQQAGYRDYRLQRASEDASFRSYLRLETDTQSLIVMDAPPQQEPCNRFIAIAGLLRDAGLNAPEIIASNLEDGFLLLTDFGSEDYLSQLNSQSEAPLYADALAALLQMQLHADKTGLPDYDEAMLLRELDLFHDWFLLELLGIELDAAQQSLWLETRQILVDSALSQPQVFVHRDYHSRNLMVVEQNNPGILDFQDAVSGPITYDLVSLLRDCYIAWPRARVQQLVLGYHETARAHELVNADAEQFMSWFNLMGIQRHLKVAGIFSRLKIRDGKARYLDDIPLTLDYLLQVCREEKSTAGLCALLEQLKLPARVNALIGD
jgi:aminoglycoside/choline kinase family phosphotransferase